MNSLDNILAGGESASEGKTEEQVTQAATEAEGQTEQQTEGQSTEGDGEGHKAPIAALQAERQKVKRYTEEVADFRKSNEALQRQVAELMQRIPVPKQEQQAQTDFFTDPDAAFNERLKASLEQTMGPVQGQLIAQAQMLAGIKYGDDKVQEAEQAFIDAMKSQRLDPADYQRVVNSPNRYAAAVQWHQRQQAQKEIGDDPAAYKAKLEAEIREKVLAELNGSSGTGQLKPATATPSNLAGARNVGARSGPAWSGPQSIADIFAR